MIDTRMNFCRYDSLGRPFGTDGVLKAMQKYGIETAILVPKMAVDADFRLGNRELFEAIKTSDQLYGYLVINPNYPKETVQIMRSAMSSRKFLALALFDGASLPYPNVHDYRDILNAHRRFSKPVFVNVANGEAIAAAEQMAKEFPSIKFIIGQMGGKDWKRMMACGQTLNMIVETSGSFDAEKIEEAIENFGLHRVVFGSNFPYSDPDCMLALIENSDIPKTVMEKILSENAKTIFKLGGQGQQALIPEAEEEEQ